MKVERFWFSRLRFPVVYPRLNKGEGRVVWWTGVWGIQVAGCFIGVVRSKDAAVPGLATVEARRERGI